MTTEIFSMTSKYKKDFPIFKNYKNLVYLDNAATTQKPKIVISKLSEFYEKYCANVHRGIYPLSEKATDLYEEARKKIALFIGANEEEIVFTSGTTMGVNAVAIMISRLFKNKKINILLSELEHHSNIVPWQQIPNNKIEYLSFDSNFLVETDEVTKRDKFDVAALTMQSNVTGSIIDIKKILNNVKKSENFVSIIDASQAVAHYPINVKDLGVDFLTFSSHKMYGPFSVGVLYIKKEWLNKLDPFFFGGGMINKVSRNDTSWAIPPMKFEAGTPPVAEAYALGFATEYIQRIGFKNISEIEQNLRKELILQLREIDEIKIYHPPLEYEAGASISFSIQNIHPHDAAYFLGKENICVRAGHHCTQILHREILKVPATLRVSFGLYNDLNDVKKFISKLKEAIKFFSKN